MFEIPNATNDLMMMPDDPATGAIRPRSEPGDAQTRPRFGWIRAVMREHPILARLLAVYLALSAVELVRILLFDRPREYDAGFYQWEVTSAPEGSRRFHWTRGATAYVLRPLWGQVVRIPLYWAHPEPPPEGARVAVRVEGRTIHEQIIRANGWHSIDLYLPATLGKDPWRESPLEMALDGAGELEPAPGREPFLEPRWTLLRKPDYVRLFTDWHPPPGPPSTWFEIQVAPTFRPAEFVDSQDDRELGIGVGEFLWQSALPVDGFGFYEWEHHEDRPFQWSRATASRHVELGDRTQGHVHIRVADPSAATSPVPIRVFWDTDLVVDEAWGDNEWHEVALMRAVDTVGVLSVHVGRTWSPERAGVSADARDLGAAVSRVEWR